MLNNGFCFLIIVFILILKISNNYILYDANYNKIKEVQTDANGEYVFDDIRKDREYIIKSFKYILCSALFY